MRKTLIVAAAAVALLSQIQGQAQTPASPKVQIAFDHGTVSLTAKDATLREVLAEWTRLGGTPFVGAERLTGGPMTLQFDKKPEIEVITSLLRGASGFVAGPRRDGSEAASTIEVVYVLATSTATAGASYSSPTAYSAPRPQISTPGAPDDEIPPVGPGREGQPPAGPDPAARPTGTSGSVAVPVIPVVTVPPTGSTGRGGGGGGGGGR
jgi:hypothetical protein